MHNSFSARIAQETNRIPRFTLLPTLFADIFGSKYQKYAETYSGKVRLEKTVRFSHSPTNSL